MLYKAEERERDLNKKSLLKTQGKNKENKSKKKKGKSKKIEARKNSGDNFHKKRSSSNKSFTINKYNFDSDFVWIKKSYRSSTRPNNINDKSKEESNFDNIFKRSKTRSKSKKEKEKLKEKILSNNKKRKESMNVKEINNKENKIFNNLDKEINEMIKKIIESNETDIEFINECNKNNSNYNKEKEEFELINIEEDPSFDFLLERNLKLNKEYDNNLYESCKCQVNGIVDQRIQSLAITLDKIKHVLSLIGPSSNIEPP